MKSVDRGAELLDEHEPGWADKIDPDTLDLGSPCNCVLGQLYRSEHPRLRHKWAAYERKLRELRLPWSSASRFGFDSDGRARFHNLTAAWRREIQKRRKS